MTSPAAPPPLVSPGIWYPEAAQRTRAGIDWLWPGYLARGAVTLLTSQWKTGKTTLVSVLIAKMARGGELAGQTVAPARVAVASEEPLDCWQRRGEKLGFGPELCLFCQPFALRPTLAAWDALVDRLVELGREPGIDAVILDPLAAFLPAGAENQTAAMLEVLQRLSRLTRQGQAVLVLHHPTKGAPAAGQLARGCGALCAYVDVIMEMSLVTSALETDRRRRIAAWSRYEETPRQRLIELSADGRDYRAILSPQEDLEQDPETAFSRHWPAIERLLAFPPRKLSRQELLTAWRNKATAPGPMALWRVLDRAVQRGLLLCEGAGTCGDPFRYWLSVLPAQWATKDDPAEGYWPLVKHVLTTPPRKMSQRQLLAQWPKAAGTCNPVLLTACLERAVAEGLLHQQGSGRRHDPTLYFFPNLDAQWEPDIAEVLGL